MMACLIALNHTPKDKEPTIPAKRYHSIRSDSAVPIGRATAYLHCRTLARYQYRSERDNSSLASTAQREIGAVSDWGVIRSEQPLQ